MAKEKRNVNIFERPWPRLPHELEICRRRHAICNLQRTDTENDVWFQESNRESGTQDSPRQDEDSQQPEHHQFGRKKAYCSRWHEHRNIDKKWKRKIFGPENIVLPTGDKRNQEQDQGSLGDLPQIQTRVDINNYMLKHCLRLFDATVSQTICYAAGTWAPNKEHERMIQST